MSIYTITLRRELLDDEDDDDRADSSEPRTASGQLADERRTDNEGKRDGETDDRSRPVAVEGARGASIANEFNLNEANWLDCSCGESSGQAAGIAEGRGRTETTNAQEAGGGKENQTSRSRSEASKQQQHSSECLEARRKQLRELRKRAKQIVHSVNVTLEVAADLSQASRIVWYKNQSKQLTSSESPVLYQSKPRVTPVKRRPLGESGNSASSSSSRSIKRTRSKRVKSLRSTGEGGVSVEEETTTEIEEELKLIGSEETSSHHHQGDNVCGGKRDDQQQGEQTVLIEKCRQESSASGSKLTIFDLQDEDYGQYTCRLIDSRGNQLADVETKLKQTSAPSEESAASDYEQLKRRRSRSRTGANLIAMDEVIEVKEGDLNIELGIQILPETNEDEELMSEEEKREFIESTTISWFKDDVKLNQQDAEVLKLFQFTYDQVEGFHRLIVRKATKETEGVYTCLVENESGTSSCTTQLVVGPGNKPKLTSQLQDVTVYVGQSLEFRIKSTGLPPIDSCQWFKDDELLIELATATTRVEQQVRSRRNERVSMSRSEEWSSESSAAAAATREDRDKVLIFRLCIDSLKLDDTGRYKCRINNEYGYDESACFVKVLQEIIEEHEEIEETIEETLRLGGGKKSTREEEEEVTTETVEQETKRQKQDRDQTQPMVLDGGQAPRFRRKLENTSWRAEEATRVTTTEEVLIVSTERDEWSGSRDQLKIRWLVDGHEVSTTTSRVDTHDESISYKAENFYDESSQEIKHKLIVRYRRAPRDGEPREVECEASNQFGTARTRSQLRWARKPRFVRTLEDTETQVSETVVLRVIVEENESSRADDLRVLRDGQLLYSSKRDGLDERRLAKNSKSRVTIRSHEETVEVEEEVVEEDEEEEEVHRRGSRRYSRRSSSSLSLATSGARRAPKSKRRCRTYEVTIEDVQVDQQGTWECQAENEAGQVSCRGDLEVFAEPRIVTDLPRETRVQPAKEIRLTVEASGSPTPVYSWFKDGQGIAEEEDRVFTETRTASSTRTQSSATRRRSSVTSMRSEDGVSISGETLIIRDARPEDAGTYQCKVENRLGQVESRESEMTVIGHGDDLRGAPRIIKDLNRVEIDEGETILLKVLAEGHPKPSQHWYKNNEIIEETTTTTTTTSETRTEVEQVGQEHKLTIRRSRVDDSGKYKVVLRNELGETESRTVEVKVNKVSGERESQRRPSAPSIVLDSQDKVVGVGSDVSFDVQVAGHPKPLITWYKNGRRMTESGDGRVSFVEEEETVTTTTTVTDGGEQVTERKETTTVHKLVIRDVRESDEAIYSLKAENDLGCSKSSLVSLSVDKRKDATDEVSKSKSKTDQQQQQVVEETTTTTEIVEREEAEARRRKEAKTKREVEEFAEESEEELDEDGNKKRKQTRTTRTTTTKTTTTTTEEEEEEEEELEDEEARRRKRTKEEQQVDEEEETISEESAGKRSKKRQARSEQVDDVQMEVDEEHERADEREKRRRASKSRSRRDSVDEIIEDETIEEEVEERTTRRRRAPRILSAPKEVVAGLGSTPELEVEVEEEVIQEEEIEEEEEESVSKRKKKKKTTVHETTTTTVEETTTTKITWLKDGQPIPDRLTRDNHIEFLERPGDQPGTKKRVMRINSLRTSDEGDYVLKVETPAGTAETAPIKVAVDRSMRPGQRASITPADIVPQVEQRAPEVVGVPEEVVAGIGSSPLIEAEVEGSPAPKLSWFKDGQPIPEEELNKPGGHLEVVDLPTDKPDVTRQALKINDLKPADAAAYHVKAENPLGEVESEPTNVRIDRSMAPADEPVVTGLPERPQTSEEGVVPAETSRPAAAGPESAPVIVSAPEEIKAGPGSKPQIEAEVSGSPTPQLTWLKDGQPITDRDLRTGHVEVVDLPTDKPDTIKQALKINDLRPTDVADYQVKAENPLGVAESHPTKLKLDRSMGPRDEPQVSGPADGQVPDSAKDLPSGDQKAPAIVKLPEEVKAGPGSSPQIVAEATGKPLPELSWLKDGQPIPERDIRLGHVEVVDLPTDQPDTIKQALKVNDLRPTDVADYQVKATNPLGEVTSEPTKLNLDRTMGPRDEPKEKPTPVGEDGEQPRVEGGSAPEIVSAPEEVRAGRGGSPQIEAEVSGSPTPQLTWLKDGQPIPERDLRTGHVEIVDLPTDRPDTIKQALKINDLRPTDVADYQVKAENPLGVAESKPTGVKIDRSMSSADEPVVSGLDQPESARPGELSPRAAGEKPAQEAELPEDACAPSIVSAPEEVVAGRGGAPVIEAEVAGKPVPEMTWFKDGQPLDEADLADGHLEVVDLPAEQPEATKKQALKINDLKPADVAAYHVKAENPLGEAESEPTNVRIDRSMGAQDEPVVTGLPEKPQSTSGDLASSTGGKPSGGESAPAIVSAPGEIKAGPGSNPEIVAEVSGVPAPQLTWLKDGQPITDRDLRTGHVEIVDLPTDKPDTIKQALKINDLRPTDVADYQVKAENSLGEAESQPTKLKLDRSMGPRDEPQVSGLAGAQPETAGDLPMTGGPRAPAILSMPKEIVAGPGSNPEIVAEVAGEPAPKLTWLKDGQPIRERQLSLGHLEVVDLPTDKPGVVKQALKVNDLRPTDAGDYQVRAENPLGTVDSEPTALKVDRSMGPRDEPLVEGLPASAKARPVPSTEAGDMSAPKIVSLPDEVVAGPGSSPQIVAEATGKPLPELSWLKDGQPIPERDLRTGHVEVVDLPTDKPDTIKQALKVNDLRPTDVADYQVKAANPAGEVTSEPTHLKLDRTMGPRDEPKVEPAPAEDDRAQPSLESGSAPEIVSAPEEVRAGRGSSPQIEAEVAGEPTPQLTWLKDGQPIPEHDLRTGHVEIVDLPTDRPDTIKQALKINDLRPTDVADYQVKAENPLGVAESKPTSVKIDRSMSSADEPVVSGLDQPQSARPGDLASQAADLPDDACAPSIVSAPEEVVAGRGGAPVIEAEVAGKPVPEMTWFKDGQPLDEADLADGHLEVVDLPAEQPDSTRKQALKINDLKPADVAAYHVKAENPLGEAESEPTNVRIDRSMGAQDEPVVTGLPEKPQSTSGDLAPTETSRPTAAGPQSAPAIVSAPEEIRAGPGSNPLIEAEVSGSPTPQLTWLKDGQPITDRDLRTGHVEVVDLLTDKPDTIKQALKINDLRPTDVADYQVKAENPLGVAESQPTKLKLDRAMGPRDEPQVSGPVDGQVPDSAKDLPSGDEKAPTTKKMPEEVLAGPGSSPQIVAEATGKPLPELSWLKDGQPIPERDLRTGHVEVVDLPTDKPDTIKQALKVNDLRPTDVADYQVKAANPLGEVTSEPTKLNLDRTMGPRDEPKEKPTPVGEDSEQPRVEGGSAPEIVSAPEEVRAGRGGSPQIEAEVSGSPTPQLTWLKDGQPIPERDLRTGHVEVVDLPTDKPDTIKQALKINDLSPTDVADYQVKAENPLGVAESQPTKLKLDQSMGPRDEPQVSGAAGAHPQTAGALPTTDGSRAPAIVSMPKEVVAGPGSNPEIVAEVSGVPTPQLTWLKDGQPITDRDLRTGHVEVVDLPTDKPDTIKQALKINDLRPTDVADYQVKAENPLGEAESQPTKLKLDRSMGPRDEPQVAKSEIPISPEEADEGAPGGSAPSIKRIPRKVVAPLGSSPVIEVEIAGTPKPEVVWLKDGRQVSDVRGHIALVELPDGTHKLAITNVKAVDQGDYVIQATNALGEIQSAPILLVIDTQMSPRDEPRVVDSTEPDEDVAGLQDKLPLRGFAPKIVRVSEHLLSELGGTVRVQVEVAASPEANVSWLVDGQQIPARSFEEGHLHATAEKSPTKEDTTVYTLEVSDLKPSDAGTYQLVAENPFGSVRSPAVSVTLRDDQPAGAEAKPKRRMRAPVIKRAPKQVVAREGTSPVLEVEVSGEPVPEIVWFRNGKRIERSDAHFTFEEAPEEGVYRLVVNECTKADEANYTVEATNEAGTDESAPIELRVTPKVAGFAPQVVGSTEEVVAGAGSSPAMEIVIRAVPDAQVTWFHDGQPLDMTARENKRKFEVTEEKVDRETVKCTLAIKDLRPLDVGAYHARAENVHGATESEPINVRIDREMGADATPVANFVEAAPQDGDESATGLGPEDSSGAKPSGKRPIRAPVIKRMPRRIVAGLGSSPSIEVVISGEPRPEVVWFKNGKRLVAVSEHVTFEEVPSAGEADTTTFRVCFTGVKMTDQAEYSLVATNEAGTIDSGPIELIVDRSLSKSLEPLVMDAEELPTPIVVANADGPIEAPAIRGLDDRVQAAPGQTVKLEAEVTGNPRPDIKWLKDGDEVELNIVNEVPGSNRHSLTLRNVNDLYDGVYSLEAKNEAGVARKEARVEIVDDLVQASVPTESAFQPVDAPVTAGKRKSVDEPREKPFIKRGLKFSQVNQGRSIQFEVQIDGKYDELVWTKDGEQINVPFEITGSDFERSQDVVMDGQQVHDHDNDDDDTSTIKASDDEDDLATGAPGKPKRRFPPRILMRPRNIVAGPGSRVAFEVRYEGEPRPEVIWYKNGERVKATQDGKIVLEESHTATTSEETTTTHFARLIIEDVQPEDVATYQVMVDNAYGQERSLPVTLELDDAMPASDDLANFSAADQPADSVAGGPLKRGRGPRILSRPRPVHAAPGSTVAFEVQVAGEPEPVVNWFRDGRIIKQSSDGHVRIEEYSNGCVRLVLSDITDADVGQYHVSAENSLGSERTIPVSLTLDETTTETTTCSEEFTQISQVADQEERHRRGGRPPRILLRPKHLSAPPGGQVTLEVLVVGQSRPSIIWYKDGKRVEADGKRVRIEEISEGYQRLIISELTTSDAGAYTVSAENDFGVSMSQPPAKLEVDSTTQVTKSSGLTGSTTTTLEEVTTTEQVEETTTFYEHYVPDANLFEGDRVPGGKRAPRFTVRPRNRKSPVGGRVDFEVKVSGEPKPDVVWYKNGLRVHTTPDGRVRVEEFSDGGSRLVIDGVEETDLGVYAAEATNELGKARTEDVQLRVTQRTEVSERTERKQRGTTTVTTRTKKTRSHYTFSEERHGYVTLTIDDAQLEHDGDYKLVVRNKWGEASTQAPLVVIPRVEPRSTFSADRSAASYDDRSSQDGRDSRNRRTPFDELEDYGHELDKSAGIFGSESRYQSGEDTYLLQLRDTEFPLRLRKYLRFGARQSPSLRSNLMDAHWGAGARVTIRERRKFREVMDEEIDDEKSGRDSRPTPMRLQQEVGTCNYGAAQLESLRVEAAERVARRSAEGGPSSVAGGSDPLTTDMMPPFFRAKLKDAVVEESAAGRQAEAVFACMAAGEPRPDYTWFRNDVLITPDVNRFYIASLPDGGSELRIRDPRLHDAGCFKCVAFNVHGNVTTRARLRVAGRPSRPEPPEYCGPVTAHEVFLQWRPPRDNIYDANCADILGYRLEMSQSSLGEDDHWQTLAADIGHEYYVVDDLRPATSYTFRVSARNKFGWSDTSYSAYVTTARVDQEGVPTRLAVPHEMRSRQYVSEVCDAHALRTCEDDLYPKLNYAQEQLPVSAETGAAWQDAYQLQAEIARGRFSIISKGVATGADLPADQRQVVLKFVPTGRAQAAQTKAEFDILRSLQHEKVARLHAAYRQDDAFVFVLERLSGLDVLTYLSSFTQYNEETVSQIIQQVMDAIEYLHFRGMCLLELQPDNVVMTNGRTTSLKLVDFSSARFVPRSGARVPQNASQTIEYCPPEVIAGHAVDTASDVWCIGVLTYVLLSGRSPFRGESEDETRENVRLGRYKYDHIYANCTPEVTRFLINVFKKHSSKRPTIEQLYENKWLLPNEFMIRKRQHATFRTDKIAAFAEEFHKAKESQQSGELHQFASKLAG